MVTKSEILDRVGQSGSMYTLQCLDGGTTTRYLAYLDGYVGFVSDIPKTYYGDSWDYDFSQLLHFKRDGNNFTMYYPSESMEQYLLKKSDFLRLPLSQLEIANYPVVRDGDWYYIDTDSSATPCTFTLNDDMTISEGGEVLSLSGTFWHSETRWLNNCDSYTLTVTDAIGSNTTVSVSGWDGEEPVYVSDGFLLNRSARHVSYNYMGDMLFTPNEQKVVDRLTTAFAEVLKYRDTNKDTKLDKAELLELIKANKCEVPELSAHKILGDFDVDNDGKISAADIKKYKLVQKNKLILEFNKNFHGLFKQFDTNKDGKLSLTELKKHAILRKLPNALKTLDKVFKLLDVNKSGFVDAKEFVTPPIALVKKFQTDFAAVLKKYDTKTVDGKIGKTELTQMAKDEGVKDVDAIVLAIFESYDKNGTGFLELSDFQV